MATQNFEMPWVVQKWEIPNTPLMYLCKNLCKFCSIISEFAQIEWLRSCSQSITSPGFRLKNFHLDCWQLLVNNTLSTKRYTSQFCLSTPFWTDIILENHICPEIAKNQQNKRNDLCGARPEHINGTSTKKKGKF